MLYYFVGEDEWEKERKMREIAKISGTTQIFKVDNTVPNHAEWLKGFVVNESLFSNNAVVVIRAFDEWAKNERQSIEKVIGRMKEKGHFIFSTDVLQNSLARKIPKENILRFEIPKPWEERAWIDWIKQKASLIGLHTSDSVCRAILDKVGTNADLLVSEIYKLLVYTCPDHNVEEKDIEAVVFDYANKSTEQLTDSIGRRALSDAVNALYELRKGGVSHIMVISVIANYFHQLLKVRLLLERDRVDPKNWNDVVKVAKLLNLTRGRAAKLIGFTFSSSSNERRIRPCFAYTQEEMKEDLLSLFDLDIDVKSTSLEPWFSILEFLCNKVPKSALQSVIK